MILVKLQIEVVLFPSHSSYPTWWIQHFQSCLFPYCQKKTLFTTSTYNLSLLAQESNLLLSKQKLNYKTGPLVGTSRVCLVDALRQGINIILIPCYLSPTYSYIELTNHKQNLYALSNIECQPDVAAPHENFCCWMVWYIYFCFLVLSFGLSTYFYHYFYFKTNAKVGCI